MESSGTELAEALRAVREGLAAAQRDGEGPSLRFKVSDVTLELSIALRHSASASGGVKAFVVSADTRGERTKAETQKLTVNLQLDGQTTTSSGMRDAASIPCLAKCRWAEDPSERILVDNPSTRSFIPSRTHPVRQHNLSPARLEMAHGDQ
ncbi:trypco2 family protein [Streptomyces sioyaensis]|uniref:trypco2 family protein n=1 Tax=Streptomyces sioyaensis TaxID=67364 RepID=UPI003795A31F